MTQYEAREGFGFEDLVFQFLDHIEGHYPHWKVCFSFRTEERSQPDFYVVDENAVVILGYDDIF